MEERVLQYEEINHIINYFGWEQQCLTMQLAQTNLSYFVRKGGVFQYK